MYELWMVDGKNDLHFFFSTLDELKNFVRNNWKPEQYNYYYYDETSIMGWEITDPEKFE